jgi:hypothetical protein
MGSCVIVALVAHLACELRRFGQRLEDALRRSLHADPQVGRVLHRWVSRHRHAPRVLLR